MPADDLTATVAQSERLHTFAHDIRNRLAGLQQVLQTLRDENDPVERSTLVQFGEQQFFKAMREVESVLDDLAVVRGAGELELHPLDLGTTVRAAADLLKQRYQRKQQLLELDVPAGIVVNADAYYMDELVGALLSNASKFSAIGATVHVSLVRTPGGSVLAVTDSGVGLSPTDLDLIFQRYTWLSSHSTNGEPQGRSTLARAHQWARAHAGSLSVTSDGPGKGSTFTLVLPSSAG